jgi:hypothetical protein
MVRSQKSRRALLALALVLQTIFAARVPAQISLSTDVFRVPVAINRDDVKAIGEGNTQVANGRFFNAMEYNPALLAHERTSFDVLQVQASLPVNSLDAFAFLRDNADQLKNGDFYRNIDQGIKAYQSAITPDQKVAAIHQINSGLSFANQFQQKVLGPVDNPRTQGVLVVPDIQVQVGNLGFSLHASLRTALTAYVGATLSSLYALQLPDNLNTLTADQEQTLLDFAALLYDFQTGKPDYAQAIPQTFAVSYMDVVGTAGYGYQLTPAISLGANLKILNRRVSTKVINADNYSSILTDLRSDFQSSVTGVTLDLGGLYRLQSTGTYFGLTLQNIIPLPKSASSAVFNTIAFDQQLNQQHVQVTIPVEFNVPFLVNFGVTHPILSNWDASFDWVDIAAQDEKHVNFGGRLRLGTEYRLEAIRNTLGLSVRGGVAERKLAGGVGINLFRVLQIDAAYAWDNYVYDNAVFASVRFGW